MLLGGPVTVRVPDPGVNDRPTSRASVSNECVSEPGRISTTWEILAASGVKTVKDPFHSIELGAPEMVGRVAADPSELNRYGGL